jgi:class 3 adenylate cyclase
MTVDSSTVDTGEEADRRGHSKRRRRRSLQRSLAITFVLVSLLSVLLLGALNFYQARNLLNDEVSAQLVNQQAVKARTVRGGLENIEQNVVVLARSSSTTTALLAFTDAFRELDTAADLLDQTERDAIDSAYGVVVTALQDADLESPPLDELKPRTGTGEYLQYHYIVQNPFEAEARRQLTEADGDESAYGQVHADQHPRLAELATILGFGDLLLVDTDGSVVYSTDKRLDFATNAVNGPYRDSNLGRAISTRLAAAPVGDAVFVDFEIYLPAGGRPSMFAAAAVRDNARTVGAVVAEIPIEALNDITTQGGGWEAAGFGDTGETYVVGEDRLMRSDSRLWLEDPDAYLEDLQGAGLDEQLGDLITVFDSTVLLQPADTKAVQEAFDEGRFLGRTDNYLGRKSLSAAGPVGFDQLDWVLVAEASAGEAADPLRDYLTRVLIAALILIPIVGIAAVFLGVRITRPVKPVVDAAAEVAAGRLDTTVPDLGHNEFGDVGRRLNTLTADLQAHEKALAHEEAEITAMLLSALPPRLVKELRSGRRELRDLIDTATVVALTVSGMLDDAAIDSESAVGFAARLSSRLEDVAERMGVERVRSSSEQHDFVAGLDTPDNAVSEAAAFVLEAAAAIEEFSTEVGFEISYRVGLSAGDVIEGVLSTDQLTYGVFGDPPRTALALNAVAAPGEILMDTETAAQLGPEWELEPADKLLDLRGEPMEAMVLKGGPVASDAVVDPA